MEPAHQAPRSQPTKKTVTISQSSASEDSQAQNQEVQDLMARVEELIIQQKECERSGKYLEADSYKKEVKKLRQTADKKEEHDLKFRHRRELKEIEAAKEEELKEFGQNWENIFTKLKGEMDQAVAELEKKHEDQITLLTETEKDLRFKESAELLNLRKIQQELAKQEKYIEAHTVQQQCLKMEKEEREQWKKELNSQSNSALNLLKQRQETECNALKQRYTTSIDEKEIERNAEQEKIVLKYRNLQQELMNQQANEVSRFTKATKLNELDKKVKPSISSLSKANVM